MMIRIDVVLSAKMERMNPKPLTPTDLLDNDKYYNRHRLTLSTKSKHVVVNTDHILYLDIDINTISAAYNREVELTEDVICSDCRFDRIVMTDGCGFVVLPQVTKMIIDTMNRRTNDTETTDRVVVLD